MNQLVVKMKNSSEALTGNILHAKNWLDRLIGLMFAERTIKIDGLLIEPCNSIHTCFMKFNLDLFFLNKNNEIVCIIRNLKPWRFTRPYFQARKVLEVKEGIIPQHVQIGDKLELVCIN